MKKIVVGSEYGIETNIPVPVERGSKYPFASLKIGNSFFVKSRDEERSAVQNRLNAAVNNFRKTKAGTGRKFIVRRVEGGIRCWRTA